jgi:hypothetical protein
VDACNPLLQAHPTWARDEHEGRGIPTSLTLVSGRLALPLRACPRARPVWAGARGDIHSSAQGPPGLGTPTNLLSVSQFCHMGYNCLFTNINVSVFRRSDGSLAFKGVLDDKLYLVDFSKENADLDACLIAMTNMGWL